MNNSEASPFVLEEREATSKGRRRTKARGETPSQRKRADRAEDVSNQEQGR